MTQQQALDILKLGHNVFLTGAAGSGKTFVLNQYIKLLKNREIGVAVTASTGIAATHIDGMTIHAWSGIGIRESLSKYELKFLLDKSYLRRRYETTQVIVIDEVSMLPPYLLDLLNMVCKAFKGTDRPFGGMQIILSGDLFQLPPISRGNSLIKYFTESDAWQEMGASVCYLEEQYRQDDRAMTSILNAIRSNSAGDEIVDLLQQRHNQPIENDATPVKLYSHNIDVDRINDYELDQLPDEPTMYEMNTRGKRSILETLQKSCLAPISLGLKQDAAVMFVKNNFEKGFVNGTLGTVIDFDEETGYPIVQTIRGRTIIAAPERWTIEEEGKIKAEVNQIPLRLAWAITVHKSQGMTLDAAEIDLSKSFVPGMGYVALSRLRALSGLRLMGLNEIALLVDERVIEIDVTLKIKSQEAVQVLQSMNAEVKTDQQSGFIASNAHKGTKPKKIPTIELTKQLIDQKKSLADIAKEREFTLGTIITHIEKLLLKGVKLDISYLQPKPEDFARIKQAFEESKGFALSPVKYLLDNKYTFEELQLARLFLR